MHNYICLSVNLGLILSRPTRTTARIERRQLQQLKPKRKLKTREFYQIYIIMLKLRPYVEMLKDGVVSR